MGQVEMALTSSTFDEELAVPFVLDLPSLTITAMLIDKTIGCVAMGQGLSDLLADHLRLNCELLISEVISCPQVSKKVESNIFLIIAVASIEFGRRCPQPYLNLLAWSHLYLCRAITQILAVHLCPDVGSHQFKAKAS